MLLCIRSTSACILGATLTLLAILRGEEAPPRNPAYQLAWADEFDRDGPPDPEKWRSEEGFMRNEELQWYHAANSYCRNGLLVIEAKREDFPNPYHRPGSRDWRQNRAVASYTSGSLISTNKFTWHFGRAEVRARFKAQSGLWPAIWTTGQGRWPHAGEIDIMEFYQGKILANFVWAGKGGKDHWASSAHPLTDFGKDTWDEDFHLWVTEWNREKIDIYLDGRLLNSLPMSSSINQDGPPINPFSESQRFRFDLAIGGTGGDPAKTTFPQKFEIDYVRIYEPAASR